MNQKTLVTAINTVLSDAEEKLKSFNPISLDIEDLIWAEDVLKKARKRVKSLIKLYCFINSVSYKTKDYLNYIWFDGKRWNTR